MDTQPAHAPDFDLIIIGAGLSGIGTACHFTDKCPGKSYTVLEARDCIGGTWDLFRYPGIRSDSDMHTLGYVFKPWTDPKAIADGPSILRYIHEAADEYNVSPHIRYHHKVVSANWDSKRALWTLTVLRTDTDETLTLTARFVTSAAGYYRYDQGHAPNFKGAKSFKGPIIHPQHWPEDLDYKDKRIVVIGSGATAVTLIPELAKDAKHVVMLQRSPTYIAARPDQDKIANGLRKILPEKLAYKLSRWKNLTLGRYFYNQARNKPEKAKQQIIKLAQKALGKDYDVDTHFTPTYNPWDQRLCLAPNGDIFKAIKAGTASVVTDTIDRFTKDGIALTSGKQLEADIIVTATGLEVVFLGQVDFSVDGKPAKPSETFGYKGMMFSGIPNLISVFGYTNASWTLRADLVSDYMCRLINHMEATQTRIALPSPPEGMIAGPWTDFQAGYLLRVLDDLPKQGDRDPWQNAQDYAFDRKALGEAPIDDGHLVLS